MITVIADDEPLALKMTQKAVAEALPNAEVHTFLNGKGIVEFAKENVVHIAFLDIRMRGITGLEIAEQLHAVQPRMNLIFVTAFDEYKSEAMDLHASGYLMKPVVAENVKKEMEYLRFPITEEENNAPKKLEIGCFGDFKVSCGGTPLVFAYTKTYELLAFLVDKRGAVCTYPAIIEALWDGEEGHLPYLKRIRSDLINVLTEGGLQDVLCVRRGALGLDTELIDCDYFDFINNKPEAIAAYQGIYMAQFSWAEETNAGLYWKKQEITGGTNI